MDYFDQSPDRSGQYQSASDGGPSSSSPPNQPRSASSHVLPASIQGQSLGQTASNHSVPRVRRRNRMITSCLECRRRKLKCNKSHPCTNCVKVQRDCVFLAPALDQASQLKLQEIKEKVGSLERLLERDVAKSASPSENRQRISVPDDEDHDLPANEDEKDLEPTPLAVEDAAYDEVDGDDDKLLDLGISLGKMRITERIGGFFRPKISQELSYTIENPLAMDRKDVQRVSSPKAILPPAYEWLKPGPAYIAPASGFFFGPTNSRSSILDFLPSRLAADRLIKQYFYAVHPVTQILHRPTFEKEYNAFWEDVSLGIEPSSSVQTIVFATLFSGVVSMDEQQINCDFGVSKASLIDNFRLGTETALSRAHFLRTTKIETLQAFVSYLLPLCRSEISRAHSVLVGAAIRMAECMGLHRDGEAYGLTPLETHVRRLIWYQLCWLDIRTCEAQGPKPAIRKEDFDVKLPLNIDDVEFHTDGRSPVGTDKFTDSTLSLIRFEYTEMARAIWIDRPRIQRRKTSLTAVLSKIEAFRKNMAKYDSLMDDRIPLQRFAKIMKALLMSRLHVSVLHLFHNSVVAPMPERLKAIMVGSGTQTLESAVALETIPELQPWAWYAGAFQQYHTAFLLLMEIYVYPQRKEADRIWKCLDYVFECDPSEPRASKGLKVLSELQAKTAAYQAMRGMRAPKHMDKHIGLHSPRSLSSPTSTQDLSSPPPLTSTPPQTESLSQSQSQSQQPSSQTIDRQPLSELVLNNETMWSVPLHSGQSPEASSSTGSVTAALSVGDAGTTDDLMKDIDWDAFDKLFPPDGQLDFGGPQQGFGNGGFQGYSNF